jgi:ADP-ribose pyrophosphatase
MPELTDADESWPVLESEDRHRDGWVVALRADRVQRPGHPDEPPFTRLVMEHPGAAVVLALDEDDRALCLWQYRHAIGKRLVQLPAGLLDVAGEGPLAVAKRELVEEAGLEAAEWIRMPAFYSTAGISTETVHYFLARGLTEVDRADFEPEHEEAEMELGWVPFAELHEAVLAGRLADAHLGLAVLLAASRLASSQRRGADH